MSHPCTYVKYNMHEQSGMELTVVASNAASSRTERDILRDEVRRILYGMGFLPKLAMFLALTAVEEPPVVGFEEVFVPELHPFQEKHLDMIRKLIPQVRVLEAELEQIYQFRRGDFAAWTRKPTPDDLFRICSFRQKQECMEQHLSRFAFNWSITIKMAGAAGDINKSVVRAFEKLTKVGGSSPMGYSLSKDLAELEGMVRMPSVDFMAACALLESTLIREKQSGPEEGMTRKKRRAPRQRKTIRVIKESTGTTPPQYDI